MHACTQALQHNIDELAIDAEAPGFVWHTAAKFMVKLGERCSVTGGLFVLRPDTREFERAQFHLRRMYNASTAFRYDGSDQEFWRSFYREPFELPVRFHATTIVNLTKTEWREARVLHTVSGFQNFDKRLPRDVRGLISS